MLKLSRTEIRNIASSKITYSRGMTYYKEGRIQSYRFDQGKNAYLFEVRGNQTYSVSITENSDGSFEHTCNCPSHVKEKGACKHVVAGLLYILKRQEKALFKNDTPPEDIAAYKVIDYFCDVDETRVDGEIFHIGFELNIDKIIKSNDDRALLTLHSGTDKLYKIQSLRKFISDYINEENIILGKGVKFIAKESEFDSASLKIMEFLMEVYDIQNVADSTIPKLFVKSSLYMSKVMLMQFMKRLSDIEFSLTLYGKAYDKVKFVNDNPPIHYDLDAYDDAICLNYHEKEQIIPVTSSGELLFCNGILYNPDERFIRNFLPLFISLGDKNKPLVFRGKMMNGFLTEVLPRLHETMQIDIPDSLMSKYIKLPLKTSIYLDKYEKGIRLELHFLYGEHEFNCFEEPLIDNFIILREKENENTYMRTIEDLGFEPHSGFYLLKNDNLIFSFLQSGISELTKISSVYYSKAFENIGIKSSGGFSVGLSVKGNIDLLEMNITYDGMSKDELRELLNSYRLKKKYYRLRDGSFIDLASKEIGGISEMLDNLGVSVRTIDTDDIKLFKSSAFYLNEALSKQNINVEKDEGFKKFVDRILHFSEDEYRLPLKITGEPREYQNTGFRWLRSLADNYLGGILADDMGLGKTLQSIMYIESILESADAGERFLIVCPTSLVYNWKDEFENFAPKISCDICSGAPSERENVIKKSKADVLITSYPLIRRDINSFKEINFNTVFIDEAQFIKNAASLNAQSVKMLNAKHRFALTGTPIENSLSELWSIFDFLMPGYLMSHTKFVNNYEKFIVNSDKEPEEANAAIESLGKRIHPFILRRMKKDVLKELPEKTQEKILTEMTDEQKKVYLAYMNDLKSDIDDEVKRNGFEKSRIKILAALTRLRQICCHPATFLENYKGGSGKLDLLMELIDDAVANGHRMLIFSQFTSMLSIIEKKLKERGNKYFKLEGDTPLEERHDYVNRFNKGEGDIFLVSLKAGGTGLNLTGADMVIHYDPWWNPAVEEQATDRVYRIGQVHNVHVIKLLTKGTIEEKIYKLQKKKKELSESVISDDGEVFISKLTKEDLEEIFS